jgi:hypothetical protein
MFKTDYFMLTCHVCTCTWPRRALRHKANSNVNISITSWRVRCVNWHEACQCSRNASVHWDVLTAFSCVNAITCNDDIRWLPSRKNLNLMVSLSSPTDHSYFTHVILLYLSYIEGPCIHLVNTCPFGHAEPKSFKMSLLWVISVFVFYN